MDPITAIGLIASCATIVQTIKETYDIAQQNVHSSKATEKELGLLLGRLSSYRGLIEGIKIQAELDTASCDRLSALDHIDGPLEACKSATVLIKNRLEKLPKYVVFGKILNKEISAALQTLDRTVPILQLALDYDQRILTGEVERYTIAIKEDLLAVRADTGAIKEDVSAVKTFLINERNHHQTREQESKRQQLRQWLSKCNPDSSYTQWLKKAHPGSGRWFLQHDFYPWLKSDWDHGPRIMWLHGRTGTGKTILLSSAIHYAQTMGAQKPASAIAYFYCSFSEKDSQSPVNMLSSYVLQICEQVPGLWNLVASLFDKVESRQQSHDAQPTVNELQDVMDAACASTDKILLFLDAPNESDLSESLLLSLSDLVSRHKNMRLLVSSTDELEVGICCESCGPVLPVKMDSARVDHDINAFVIDRMHQEQRLCRLPNTLQNDIRFALVDNAKGSFRWAECQLVALVEHARSEAAIRRALQTIAPGLDVLYTKALLALPTADYRPVRFALLWLTFALRPLHLDEISEAMIFEDECNSIQQSARLFPAAAEEILKRCRTLVHYNGSSKLASLAHSSVREYLLSRQCQSGSASAFYLNEEDALQFITRRSIEYLNLPNFSSGFCLSRREAQTRARQWPLFEYVSETWPVYARFALPSSASNRTEAAFLEFFDSSRKQRCGNFGAWVQVYLPRHIKQNTPLSTPLYYAAREGLVDVVRMILRVEGIKTLEEGGGSRLSTPLHVASAFGHTEVVRALLEVGANPNEKNGKGERGIEWAMLAGYSDIVQALLDAGAVPVNEEELLSSARSRRISREMLEKRFRQFLSAQNNGFRSKQYLQSGTSKAARFTNQNCSTNELLTS